MRLADYIFETLADHGVDTVYMVTGRGALFLTDAVAKSTRIRAVCTHHAVSYTHLLEARNRVARTCVMFRCNQFRGQKKIRARLKSWRSTLIRKNVDAKGLTSIYLWK